MQQKSLRIGTGKSPFAMYQARLVQSLLQKKNRDLNIELIPIVTTGDKTQKSNRNLTVIGGKGLFLKELEIALTDNTIDLAVHSLKDVPTWCGADYSLPCVLDREDPREAFISKKFNTLQDVSENSILGTSSPRRLSQASSQKNITCVPFRGNVGTRLEKINKGDVDFTFLALAGLNRLGMSSQATQILSIEEMIPAIGQGAITIETLAENKEAHTLLKSINHTPTAQCVNAERTLLATLGGSCITPIGCYCSHNDNCYKIQVYVGREDGSKKFTLTEKSQPDESPTAFGYRCALLLHQKIPSFTLSELGLHQKPPATLEEVQISLCGF